MRIPVISATESGGMPTACSGASRPGSERSDAGMGYLSQDAGGVKFARVFRMEPPVNVM